MQCPMCYYLYDEREKIPRNLHCGHTVCQECLSIVYEKKKMLDCPTCRYKHSPQIKPTDLTKNYVALQLASQKFEIRKNNQFCPDHDQPFKFFCQTDQKYICVECIVDHTGHHFVKQDQLFFSAKKMLSTQIAKRQQQQKNLSNFANEFIYVKQQLVRSYEQSVRQLDEMFQKISKRLTQQHARSKQQLNYFLQKQLQQLQSQQLSVKKDIQINFKQKQRLQDYLEKLQKNKKADEEYAINESNVHKHNKPSPIEFPVVVMPFTGQESFVQICHKVNPKICFFGERKKLLTLCPISGVYSLTTINNCEIQYYASSCTLPTGQIFITGGGSSNNCYLFSPRQTNALQKKRSMANARKQHSCVYLNGKVYVISGYDGKNKGMAGCQAYDIFKQQWKNIKSLNTPRCAFAAVVCKGKIYVFGGYDGKDRLNTIEVYSSETARWNLLNVRLPFALSNAAAVTDNNSNIFVLGGGWSEGFNLDVFRFNIETQQLITIQRMNKGRDLRNKAIKFKNQIFTIGGNSYDGQRLDLRQNTWLDVKPYNDLVTDNLDSWCCALSYNSHQYQLQKYNEMSKILHKKYKDFNEHKMQQQEILDL